jgi:hypothetical protein
MEMEARMSVFQTLFLERYYSSPKVIMAIHIDAVKPMSENGGQLGPLSSGLQSTYLAAILGAPEVAIPSKYHPLFFGGIFELTNFQSHKPHTNIGILSTDLAL